MADKNKGDAERKVAVALEYEPGKDAAPRLTAKGHGEVAEKIIAIAEIRRGPRRAQRAARASPVSHRLRRADTQGPLPRGCRGDRLRAQKIRGDLKGQVIRNPADCFRTCQPGSRSRLSGIAKGAWIVTIPDSAAGASGMTAAEQINRIFLSSRALRCPSRSRTT